LVLEMILSQETEFQFDSFSADDALKVGLEACRIAREQIGKPVAVNVELDEHPLFAHYMDGTDQNNLYWVTVKKNVVKKFGHSSLYVGLECKNRNTTFLAETGLPETDYRAEGGSFPLIIRGKGRVGTITVSGLTGEEDHALAVDAMRNSFFSNKE